MTIKAIVLTVVVFLLLASLLVAAVYNYFIVLEEDVKRKSADEYALRGRRHIGVQNARHGARRGLRSQGRYLSQQTKRGKK